MSQKDELMKRGVAYLDLLAKYEISVARLAQAEAALRQIAARPCRVFSEPGEDCNVLKNKVPCEPCIARAALAGVEQP